MKYIVLLLVFSLSIFAENISVDSFNKLKIIKEKNIKVVEFKDQDSIYILKGLIKRKNGKRPILFYMTKDLKYTFLGRGFNEQNQRLYIPKDMSKYEKYANFTYGKGKDKYYLFTDPECPYCRKFEKMLFNKNLEDKIKIFYFLYPLAFHKEAIPMSEYILSKKDRLKALKEIIIDNSKEYKKFSNQKSEELSKSMDVAFEIGVMGTPSLYDGYGKSINYLEFLK